MKSNIIYVFFLLSLQVSSIEFKKYEKLKKKPAVSIIEIIIYC